jgi:CheY-like chemotaxis protein
VTLLICDDHKTLTDALAMVVERDDSLRLVAEPVHDASRAVDLCLEHRPNVVLMDIEFKAGIDGIEATRRIRRFAGPAGRIPIIGVSGRTESSDAEAGKAAGMDAYLRKPASAAILSEALAAVVARPGKRGRR